MKPANKKDLTIFKNFAQMPQEKLLKNLTKILKIKYQENKVIATPNYILCEGNIPIMLVAHLDTVFSLPPRDIFFDQEKQVMWSPQGLGADDRAGVFSIIEIIKRGYRPHICFCTDEEQGCRGAGILTLNIKTAPFDIKYIIELDRQGSNDCVFYTCANDAFEFYVETFGFVTDWGTYSDISEICPAWKIAGVNLSIGEVLHFNHMFSTIKKVCTMLDEADNAPYFEYKEDKLFKRWGYSFPMDEWEQYETKIICSCCKKGVPFDEAVKVKKKNMPGVASYYCVNCLATNDDIEYCILCGEPFEKEYEHSKICPSCKNHFPEVSVK